MADGWVMKAEIVSIGTELLLGTITDTNASYLARRLAGLGIDCYYVSQVGDNLVRLTETLRRAWERSDLTVTTGGLGPTGDDLTREAIAAMLGETPSVISALEENLRTFFVRRGVQMPARNLKQAWLIPSAQALANPIGTAPGWWTQHDTADGPRMIVSMPGVPYEMKRMWEQEVEPRLRHKSGTVIVSRTLKTMGVGESALEEMVADLMDGSNPTLAPYAKPDGVYLRITAKAEQPDIAQAMIANLEQQVRARLGDVIYGADDDTPGSVVASLLRESGLSLAVLEVGAGAIGSVAPLLASSGAVRAALSLSSLGEAGMMLGQTAGFAKLEDAAVALCERVGADLALAIRAEQVTADADGVSVSVNAEIVLVPVAAFGQSGILRASPAWKTDMGEVQRLLGLAALTLLRRWLISQGRHTG